MKNNSAEASTSNGGGMRVVVRSEKEREDRCWIEKNKKVTLQTSFFHIQDNDRNGGDLESWRGERGAGYRDRRIRGEAKESTPIFLKKAKHGFHMILYFSVSKVCHSIHFLQLCVHANFHAADLMVCCPSLFSVWLVMVR